MSRDFTPLIPQGVQCYFGEEVSRRRKVESVLAGVMRGWGFGEIILPFFDYLESFSYGLGAELADRAYRFLDRDGSLLALRPDLTPLVAKTVATRMTAQPLPIQLFYSGEVFRHERAGAGRQKESYQIGLESMGSSDPWADIEVLLIAVDCLSRIGAREFKIALGHVGFFHGIVERLGLPDEKAKALRDAIDHKDCGWLENEIAPLPIAEDKKRFLIDLPNYAGGAEVLQNALSIVENPRSRAALLRLSEIDAVMKVLGLEGFLTFDLSEVRGLDYYTGIVFKIYGRAPSAAEGGAPVSRGAGELGGGGRYDGLLAKFGWDLPAVGFSFTLDRLLPLVRAATRFEAPVHDGPEEIFEPSSAPADKLFRRVWELRQRGAPVRLARSA